MPPHLARWHRSARTRGHAIGAAIRGWCERFARDHAARLTPLAPTQSEPPFGIAQGIVLVVFALLTWKAAARFVQVPHRVA